MNRFLSAPHALRHKTVLGRTVKRLAFRAHCFACAGVTLALLHKAHLSRAVKWLAVRAHGLAITRLGRSRTDREAGDRVSSTCPPSTPSADAARPDRDRSQLLQPRSEPIKSGFLQPRQTQEFDPSPVFHKRVKDGLLPLDLNVLCDALRTPTPPWTLSLPQPMMHATTDCGRPHGHCGLAAEPGPREV